MQTIDGLLDEVLAARGRAFARERAALVPIDPFALFGRERHELTHSAVLRWLLDEQESHGLGRQFAEAVLKKVGLELPAGHYTTAVEVRGAESILDVLLESPALVVGIENKVFSSEGVDQTRREWADLEHRARQRPFALVYLTRWGGAAQEKRARALAWSAVSEVLTALGADAPLGTRPWLEGIRHHIDRVLGTGGSAMAGELGEDVKVLLSRWADYQQLRDTRRRADDQLRQILGGVANAPNEPWTGDGWKQAVDDGIYVRRLAWGDDNARVRFAIVTWSVQDVLGYGKHPCWSGIQVVGTEYNQAKLCEMLQEKWRGFGDDSKWTFQKSSKDGAVMFRNLKAFSAEELIGGEFAKSLTTELRQLAAFAPMVVDAFLETQAR